MLFEFPKNNPKSKEVMGFSRFRMYDEGVSGWNDNDGRAQKARVAYTCKRG